MFRKAETISDRPLVATDDDACLEEVLYRIVTGSSCHPPG